TWNTMRFLDGLNSRLMSNGQMLYAVPGNHDNHVVWMEMLKSGLHDYRTGGAYARTNIVLLPRTGQFVLEGLSFAVAGGAVSIDRDSREEGVDWWPEEMLTDAEVENFPAGHVDVLVSHDCSDKTPWGFQLVPDRLSMVHRHKMDTILDKTAPDLHFHGHMHKRFDWQRPTSRNGEPHWTQVYGLDCNGRQWSAGILNPQNKEFSWMNS